MTCLYGQWCRPVDKNTVFTFQIPGNRESSFMGSRLNGQKIALIIFLTLVCHDSVPTKSKSRRNLWGLNLGLLSLTLKAKAQETKSQIYGFIPISLVSAAGRLRGYSTRRKRSCCSTVQETWLRLRPSTCSKTGRARKLT